MWPLTRAVKWIMAVLFGIWVLMVIAARMGSTALFEEMALTPVLVFPGGHVWQVATYMWVHALGDYSHILLNLLFLWMFGGALELAWGTRAFVRFYLSCGIGAGIAVFLVGWWLAPAVPTVGASGAIYGLVVAWALLYPNRMVYLFGVVPIRGRYFAMIPIGFALLDFLVGGTRTSHTAHLAGMAMGALLVTGWWRPSKLWNQVRWWRTRRRLRVVSAPRSGSRVTWN